MVSAGLIIPQLMWRSQVAHSLYILFLTSSVVRHGAKYMHYKMDTETMKLIQNAKNN